MKLSSAVLLILLLAVNVSAQLMTGTLVGRVTDESGSLMSGVLVVVTNVDTNYTRPGTTNENGLYSISNLNPGNYRVDFQKEQFKKAQATIELGVNETRRVDVSMVVGAITQVADVQSGISMLQTDTSSISGIVDRRQILSLPSNGRFVDAFVQLLAGASRSVPGSHLSSRGGMNVGGVDEHYQSYFLDGFDNVDPVIRNFSYRPALDGVQELRVEESGYSAEFGRNGGAVVNVITKSGTNDWHGSLWEFHRNENLDAQNFFAIPSAGKPPLIRNQFGGTIGGPLKRDKTFVFGWYEGLRQKTGQVHRATVPTIKVRSGDLSEIGGPSSSLIDPIAREVLAAFPLPNLPGTRLNRVEVANRIEDDNNFSARIDHQLLASTRVMGRYSGNVAHIVDPFRTETGGSVNLSGFGQTADRYRTNIGISLLSVIGQNVVNEFRAGFNRFRQPLTPLNRGTAAMAPLMGFVKAFPLFRIGEFDPIGSGTEFRRAANVYDYVDNVSWVRGNHLFKLGGDARRYLFNGYSVPANIFAFTRPGSAAVSDFLLGRPSTAVSFDGFPGGNTRKFEFAAYAQDDWKIGSRLTLNYGLRWEYYGRMTERVNKQALWVADCNCMKRAGIEASEGLVGNDFNNFAPRLGFAWRPVGDRLVIRASAGIFYDNDMRHNTEVFANPPFFFAREFNAPASSPTFSNPFPENESVSTLRPNTFDQYFRDTYVEQWALDIQHQFGRDLSAGVSYVGNHSVKGRRIRNVNQSIGGVAPYPGFSDITLFEQAGSSNYSALQFHVERRFSKGLGVTSAYTWGHAIDDRPGQGSGPSQDYYNMRAERGNSDFDVRHTWVVSGTYELPFAKGKPWGGWNLNAISTAQSGRPYTVIVLPSRFFQGLRPNVVPGVDLTPANQDPNQWINPAAFSLPVPGSFGNLGRNTLQGPGFYNLDMSVVKTTHISESSELQFRAEFFNILNHPNFSVPNAEILGPSFGAITSTASPERQIQFGVKLGF